MRSGRCNVNWKETLKYSERPVLTSLKITKEVKRWVMMNYEAVWTVRCFQSTFVHFNNIRVMTGRLWVRGVIYTLQQTRHKWEIAHIFFFLETLRYINIIRTCFSCLLSHNSSLSCLISSVKPVHTVGITTETPHRHFVNCHCTNITQMVI
jgi:hypothetical protein